MSQQLLSIRRVVEMLDISTRSVYRHMQSGNLRYIQLGSLRRVKTTDLSKFISLCERSVRAQQ